MPADAETPFDESALAELRDVGGQPMVEDLIHTFLAQVEQNTIELAAAEAAGDLRALVMIAHTIAGSSAALGGRAVARAAREIEHLALEGRDPALAFAKVAALGKSVAELTAALSAQLVA